MVDFTEKDALQDEEIKRVSARAKQAQADADGLKILFSSLISRVVTMEAKLKEPPAKCSFLRWLFRLR